MAHPYEKKGTDEQNVHKKTGTKHRHISLTLNSKMLVTFTCEPCTQKEEAAMEGVKSFCAIQIVRNLLKRVSKNFFGKKLENKKTSVGLTRKSTSKEQTW